MEINGTGQSGLGNLLARLSGQNPDDAVAQARNPVAPRSASPTDSALPPATELPPAVAFGRGRFVDIIV